MSGNGSVTASAGGNAVGISSIAQPGAQNVEIGDVTATSTAGMAGGVVLDGSDSIRLNSSETITVAAAAGGAGVAVHSSGADTDRKSTRLKYRLQCATRMPPYP